MKKNELMIGDVVNSPKDLKRMRIIELKRETVSLMSLDGKENSERSYEEIDPITFFDGRIFSAMGFVDRNISTTFWDKTVDILTQLIDPNDSTRFFTITVIKKENDPRWHAKIANSNFEVEGAGPFMCVSDLQNLVRSCTGLEFNIEGL